MPYFGRGATGGDSDSGQAGAGYRRRASVYGAFPKNGWVYAAGTRMGRWYLESGSSYVRLAMGVADSGGNPAVLRGYTSEMTVANPASYSGDCSLYSANIVATEQPNAPGETAIPVKAGEIVYIAIVTRGATVLFQEIQAQYSPYSNRNMYTRDGSNASTIPDNPFGAVSNSYEGNITAYLEYEENVAPTKPVPTAPLGSVAALTPAFQAPFVDGNSARGDILDRYQIQIRKVSDGSIVFDNTMDASGAETTAMNWTYSGTALPTVTPLEWRVRFWDWMGAVSDFSDWKAFQVNGGSLIDTIGPPLTGGKIADTTLPTTAFTYKHLSALAGNRVRVQILRNGAVVRGPFEFAKAMTVNTAQSFTWADLVTANGGAISPLQRGETYQVSISARDSNNVWGAYYSGPAFLVNSLPNVPTNVQPSGGAIYTTPPKVTFVGTDPDNVPADMIGLARVIRLDNGQTYSGAATYNAVTGLWEYQVPALGSQYTTWRVQAALADTFAVSAYSPEVTFVYALGPTVTITSPTAGGTVTTNRPIVAWTTANQTKYRVLFKDHSTGATIWDSGTVTSGNLSAIPPSGFVLDNMNIDVTVTVTDTNNLTATSTTTNFLVDFPDIPANLNFTVSPYLAPGDREASAVQVSWTKYPGEANTFVEAILVREPVSGGGLADVDTSPVIVGISKDYNTESMIDYLPASGKTYNYRLQRIVVQGTEFKPSSVAQGQITLKFRDVVICSATDPSSLRSVLRILTDGEISPQDDAVAQIGWGASKPKMFVGPADWDRSEWTFQIINDQWGRAETYRNNLELLRTQKETVCIRDNRGYKAFGYLQTKIVYAELGTYQGKVTITEVRWLEGF